MKTVAELITKRDALIKELRNTYNDTHRYIRLYGEITMIQWVIEQ